MRKLYENSIHIENQHFITVWSRNHSRYKISSGTSRRNRGKDVAASNKLCRIAYGGLSLVKVRKKFAHKPDGER